MSKRSGGLRQLRVVGVALLALVATQVSAQEPSPIPKDSWREFASPDKRYKLLMPGKPEVQRKPAPGAAPGMRVYVVDLKSSAFLVATLDIPPREMERVSVEKRLDAASKGFMFRVPGSTLVSEKKVALDRHPGREFVVKAGDKGTFVVRAYLVDDRLYLLTAAGKDFTADHADVVKFFSSLKLKPPVYAAATSFDGLLGYWSFDEGDGKLAKDSAGGGHHAAIHGARRVDGKRGKALEFDGKAHLNFGPARRFDFANGQKFSIVGWFQTTSTRTGSLLRMSNPRFVNPDGKPYGFTIGFRDRNLIVEPPNRRGVLRDPVATSKLRLDDGRWHHFAVLMNVGRFDIGIYIDGQPVPGSAAGMDPEPFATTARTLGAGFEGRLDELAIFNRQLKPAEIQALAGKDYGFEDRPRPPLKLAAEMEWADPLEFAFEPGQEVYGFGFDPSGKYLVTYGAVWDAWNGKRIFSFHGPGQDELVRGGKLLVRMGSYAGPGVLSYDLDSHETKHVVETGPTSFCLSQDEKYVFALDRSTMRKVDLDSCLVLESWRLPRAVDDGSRLGRDVYCARAEGVAVCDSRGIMLLSVKNGALLWDLPLKSVVGVALAPDGNQLACLVPDEKYAYKVHLVDVKAGKTVHTLEGAGQLASRLAYAANGKYLTVASVADQRGQTAFWNVARRQLVRTIKHTLPPAAGHLPAGRCLGLCFSPDGQKLAARTSGVTHGGIISVIDVGLALNLSADEVKALDVRKNAPARKFDRKVFEPRPRRPFGDDAALKLQFKDSKITGFHRFTDTDPSERGTKSPPVKLFLLPLEAGRTYVFEIKPNLGETWEDNQYRMRIEDADGKTVASNLRKPGDSLGPIPGRLTLTAPKGGTYRLVVMQNLWVQRGFTLSVRAAKD